MAISVIDIRGNHSWLTRKGGERTHRFTKQFDKEHVHATAALISTSWFDADTSVGFVQSVSASGVEDFGHKNINVGMPGAVGIGAYEMANLRREGLTSLTCELSGDGGAAAQFTFFILAPGDSGGGDGGRESDESDKDRGPSPQSRDMLLGFDRETRELASVHEIEGDATFVAAAMEAWSDGRKGKDDQLVFVGAGEAFQLDPDARYVLDEDGGVRLEKERPRDAR